MTKRPHDAIVKAVFGNPRHAAAELRHMLSEDVANAIDWDTLTLESGEFVDEELADHHSDLLFSAMATGGVPVLVYLLLEHQSSPDSGMPLRFLGYVHRVWVRWRDAHPGEPLPLIVPGLLSQVEGGWTKPRRLSEMFSQDAPAALLAMQPSFEFAVDDLAKVSDEDLRARSQEAVAKVALWIMRDVRSPEDLLRSMSWWAPMLVAVMEAPSGKEAAFKLLQYVAHAADRLHYEEFRARLKELAPAAEKLTMTIAEQLEARGEARGHSKGVAEGEARGVAEGEVRGEAKMLLLVLRGRGLEVPDEFAARLQGLSSEELESLAERALVVARVEELFVSN